jgi:hypothetical protein
MRYGSFKLLPSVFAAKFELLVNEKKKFWRRGSRARRFLGLCRPDRDVRHQEQNHSPRGLCAFHVGNLQRAKSGGATPHGEPDRCLTERSLSVESRR